MKKLDRRQFLILGCGAVASVFLGGSAYFKSGCPLSNSGICVGPCAAFIDRNQDGICDRIQDASINSSSAQESLVQECTEPEIQISTPEPVSRSTEQTAVACPFGLINDPYPGKCGRYIDCDGNGICDLSEVVEADDLPSSPTPQSLSSGVPTPTPSPTLLVEHVSVVCPFGLVNDPYPGRCGRYIDLDGNGICDLSQVVEVDELTPSPTSQSPSTVAPMPSPTPVVEQVKVACPFGLINDPYPGKCRRYRDLTGTGYCDLSEPESLDQSSSQDDAGGGQRHQQQGRGE